MHLKCHFTISQYVCVHSIDTHTDLYSFFLSFIFLLQHAASTCQSSRPLIVSQINLLVATLYTSLASHRPLNKKEFSPFLLSPPHIHTRVSDVSITPPVCFSVWKAFCKMTRWCQQRRAYAMHVRASGDTDNEERTGGGVRLCACTDGLFSLCVGC